MGTSNLHVALARLTQRLDELQIPYAVCGAMALNAHGHLRATADLNVLLTEAGLARFQAGSLGRGWVARFPGSRGMRDAETQVPIDVLVAGGVPGDGQPRGVTFADPAQVAVEIAGAKYVSLGTLIEMKLASGMSAPDRPRDLDDVIQLIRIHRLGEHFADGLHPYVQAKYRELWGYAQRPTSQPE